MGATNDNGLGQNQYADTDFDLNSKKTYAFYNNIHN